MGPADPGAWIAGRKPMHIQYRAVLEIANSANTAVPVAVVLIPGKKKVVELVHAGGGLEDDDTASRADDHHLFDALVDRGVQQVVEATALDDVGDLGGVE